MDGAIYLFKNTKNRRCYVGQTVHIHERYREHIYQANKGSNLPLHRALRKYGIKSFEFKILEFLPDCIPQQLDEREQYYIQKYQAYTKGYNCTLGGEGNLGLHHTEETKKLIGEKSKNRSPESNRKISEKLKGRKIVGEQRQKMIKNLKENASPKAIEWHKSEEGLAWHRKQGEYLKGKTFDQFEKHKLIKHICIECGKEFETYSNRSKYCCGACEQRYRRKHLNKITRICQYCGKPFETDRYGNSKYCSSTCSNKATRWAHKQND